jgi:uncharacterized membrane protein YfcA
MPVLVYLFGLSPVLATSYSLFIVGSTSLIGTIDNYRKGLVSVKTALLFGLSSITTVFATRKFLIPIIPDNLFAVGGFVVTHNILTMVLFAVLMIVAATAMIRNGKNPEPDKIREKKLNLIKLLLFGMAIGLATGILGAGGGFLLIPTLVLLVGMPMKEAVGTSLLIIALNSLIGFIGDLGHFQINWVFLLIITAIATTGIFIGGAISKKINGVYLKKGFGWFLLIMGTYILVKEVFVR